MFLLPIVSGQSAGDKCFAYTNGEIQNDCSGKQYKYYCIIDKNGPSSNVATPDFLAGNGICDSASLEDPPSESLMILDIEQPDPMCIGSKAKYVCDAGGVNVREVCLIFPYIFVHFFLWRTGWALKNVPL